MSKKSLSALMVIALVCALGGAPQSPQDEIRQLRLSLANCELRVSDADRKLRRAEEIERRTRDVAAVLKLSEEIDKESKRIQADMSRLLVENQSLRNQLDQCRAQVAPPQAPPVQSPSQVSTRWKVLESTSIQGTVKQIKPGTIFKTLSGNVFEVVEMVLLLELELNPNVTVLVDDIHFFRLIIEGVDKPILCKRLSGASGLAHGKVIESTIDGDFNGIGHGSIYKMGNGQVWEQTCATSQFRTRLSPKIIIWQDRSDWRMRVDGFDKSIAIKLLSNG